MSIKSFLSKEADPSSVTQYGRSSPGDSSSGKSFFTTESGNDDPKGPLGLNLLHSPAEPLIDFIFVHGLGGGSRKTWSKTGSISHYWPQEWLPKDPAFKHVRVHSFGYDSDWSKGKDNCLDIFHFAKSLLGELSTSPHLGSKQTAMVLLGHSMGGLVIKKTYLLASQDTQYHALLKRFYAMYFFATPHRGSDSARLLENILHITYSRRAYVSDLKRGSHTLQLINEDFRQHAGKIELWSFYETYKLNVGLFKALIVDPNSATLGYPDEQQIPLGADHRSICKFEGLKDPKYVTVRNALASTVAKISSSERSSKDGLRKEQIKALGEYIGVCDQADDDLILVDDTRMPGTCAWFEMKPSYERWKDFDKNAPMILLVTGKPAAGKSVLAGYVINQLRQTKANCSFYFFKHADKHQSRLSACLRSLAFQMACMKPEIRDIILAMRNDNVRVDNEDPRILWRKLFLSGAFQAERQPHYWVIDALDECASISHFFDTMLAKIDSSIPLRILITSRETPELGNQLSMSGLSGCAVERMMTADTLADIKLVVEERAKSLAIDVTDNRDLLISKIMEKSQGSFLWTVLVLNELTKTYTDQEMRQVLDDVPREIKLLYRRSLDSMTREPRNRRLGKAILTWVTSTIRPLHVEELGSALELDIGDSFPKLEESVMALCGQLLTIDKFQRVQVTHESIREYLCGNDIESEFAIDKIKANTQLAKACLSYLTSDEMRPPRTGRRGATKSSFRVRSRFSTYACAAFCYHLSRADPLDNSVLELVVRFLRANILSWIEVIAKTKDLTQLIRTAKHLSKYADSSTLQRSPLCHELHMIRGWAMDLARIAAKFADALIASPSAIYSLILPFCPSESKIYQTPSPGKMVEVSGLAKSNWDDRLSCMKFQQGQTTAICYGENFFAVGLNSGMVAIYHTATCQEQGVVQHNEGVRFLQITTPSDLIIICGLKIIAVWEIRSRKLLQSFASPQRPIDMVVDGNVLLVASAKNFLASWKLDADASSNARKPWNDSADMSKHAQRAPSALSISVGHKMMAVAYSGRPIVLWDLLEDAYFGTCGKKLSNGETSTHLVTAVVFNPNSAIDRLVASYLDGELILMNPFQDEAISSVRANCHTLTASPDGHLLAGAVGSGTIQIYEFETLTLLYQVKSTKLHIRQLAFGQDGLHLADVRGSECNVWQPALLVHDSAGDSSSEHMHIPFVEATTTDAKPKVVAISVDTQQQALYCSKEDGSVCLYNIQTGAYVRTLYRHNSSVHLLTWWPNRGILMSTDTSNKIHAWKMERRRQEGWVLETLLLDTRLDSNHAITQVLVGETAAKFLISTRQADYLWTIDGQQEAMRAHPDGQGSRKWLQHPESEHHLICVEGAIARVHCWSDWSEVATVSLDINLIGHHWKSINPSLSQGSLSLLLEASEPNGPAKTHGLFLYKATKLSLSFETEQTRNPQNGETSPPAIYAGHEDSSYSDPLSAKLASLSHHITHVIGVLTQTRVVFLDTHSWVSSFDLDQPREQRASYTRHFFLPYDWFSGIQNILCALSQRNILVAYNSDMAVIKGGLDYSQVVEI
ncbi:NACHT and WD domain protein [Aspergillus uvarum CBS 121591]|uniref:NACHT and WD domain protein n=1 Tax=Aspergillus uvarum CBS 121591 TaxID=1448315 RepID=A0A319D5Z8_9EURO|nr:NACHT and WD domain protein [Aspergillus uvarum CBS 121591]PYH86403.1 NACHT and WD domain protein [Aspergillus uvarum CBS 121591]